MFISGVLMMKFDILNIGLLCFLFNGCVMNGETLNVKISSDIDIKNSFFIINGENMGRARSYNAFNVNSGLNSITLNEYSEDKKIIIKRHYDVKIINGNDYNLIFDKRTDKEIIFDEKSLETNKELVKSNNLEGKWIFKNDNNKNPSTLLIIKNDSRSEFITNKNRIKEILNKNIKDIKVNNEYNYLIEINNKDVKVNKEDSELLIVQNSFKDNCITIKMPNLDLINKKIGIDNMIEERFCKIN